MAKKQTAGRDHLGELAPKFAQLNDVFEKQDISTRIRRARLASES